MFLFLLYHLKQSPSKFSSFFFYIYMYGERSRKCCFSIFVVCHTYHFKIVQFEFHYSSCDVKKIVCFFFFSLLDTNFFISCVPDKLMEFFFGVKQKKKKMRTDKYECVYVCVWNKNKISVMYL